MKNINIMWVILAALLAVAACAEDDDGDGGGDNGDETGAGGDDTGTGEEDTGTGEEDTGEGEPLAHFTFDDDDEGWTAEEGGWTYNPTEGTWDGVLEYTGTDESNFIQVIYPSGVDWSMAEEVEMTLAVTDAVTGGFQIFTKTGPEWVWNDRWFNLPVHDQFDTYSFRIGSTHEQPSSADSSLMVDLTAVMALGLGLSSGSDAVEPGSMSVSLDEVIVR